MRHVHTARARERALMPEEFHAFLTAAFESNIRRQFKVGLQRKFAHVFKRPFSGARFPRTSRASD